MGTRCYIGRPNHRQEDCLTKLTPQSRNLIRHFFQIVDEMTLERGMVCSMPLVLTESGLMKIKSDIKNRLFKYLAWAEEEGFSEYYAVQSAVNNGLCRIRLWKD
ncbi:hypothetical protein [Neisseria weaveri]|uniref:hypothetical protein n=1 Tax=Neisseria weaveri TaxID=28091 RepID=UPI0002230AB9|nr:hypothetical protein [Neisseria weaveri]EGV36059.1 hypothetical protein l13_10830 [Neisseria weaveri ATCC 51223]